MNDLDQSPPETPPGIDPEVPSRIDSPSASPSTMESSKRVVDQTKKNDATVPSSDATAAFPQDVLDARDRNRTPPKSRRPSPLSQASWSRSEINQDQDEGIWHERAPWAPPPTSSQPSPVADFAEPSETPPNPVPTQSATPDAFPPTHAKLKLPSPPSSPLSAFFNNAVTYLSSCIGNYFTTSPGIIEYSDADIRRKTKVCIEAQELEIPGEGANSRIIRVAAIVTDAAGVFGVGDVARRVDIRAKHKRVREILRGSGGYVAEEVYGKQIRAAFRELREA